jgi:hypothetical protein
LDKHFSRAFQLLDDAFGPETWRYKDAGVGRRVEGEEEGAPIHAQAQG